MLVAFWLLIMRCRSAASRQQSRRDCVGELEVGDEVMTLGGLFGVIREVGEHHVVLEIAPETSVRLAKSAVTARTAAEPEATETPETSLP